MTFNEFVKSALSNDIVCIMDDVYRGKIIHAPEAAFRWIDSKYSETFYENASFEACVTWCLNS